MKYTLKKNQIGYYEVFPKPSLDDLKSYYRDTYYQEDSSQYEKFYSNKELEYFTIEPKITEHIFSKKKYLNKSLLDLGCGEGFFSKFLFDKGWDVQCVDFSRAGISIHNQNLLKNFTQAEISEYLLLNSIKGSKYGLINLENVLEHVIDPVDLLFNIKPFLGKDSILRIRVPNDFSDFQNYLLSGGHTSETWINPPEHLSYFNIKSLRNLISHVGLKIISIQADFAIEQLLLCDHTNYWKDRNLGKYAHSLRLDCSNYLAAKDIQRYIEYREAAADLEFGRLLIAFVRI